MSILLRSTRDEGELGNVGNALEKQQKNNGKTSISIDR